jgi:hypothetical protein
MMTTKTRTAPVATVAQQNEEGEHRNVGIALEFGLALVEPF